MHPSRIITGSDVLIYKSANGVDWMLFDRILSYDLQVSIQGKEHIVSKNDTPENQSFSQSHRLSKGGLLTLSSLDLTQSEIPEMLWIKISLKLKNDVYYSRSGKYRSLKRSNVSSADKTIEQQHQFSLQGALTIQNETIILLEAPTIDLLTRSSVAAAPTTNKMMNVRSSEYIFIL
jgi:hypothetical protein